MKKIYWPEGQRWVKLRVTARTIKTIEKKGLQAMANEAGIDLWKLPFEDARPERLQWLAENPMRVPTPKNPKNKMRNPERLAASKKKPIVAKYLGELGVLLLAMAASDAWPDARPPPQRQMAAWCSSARARTRRSPL